MSNASATVWHTLTASQVCHRLECPADQGLDDRQVADRSRRHGANQLTKTASRRFGQILAEQLRGSLFYLLLVAAALSVALGETRDAMAIITIVALNAVFGFIQDYRAERAMAALERLSEPPARVRRGGVECRVEARELVPGDILLLAAGDRVAADGRLLEAFDLHVEEAALTGESQAIVKDVAAQIDPDLPLGDRSCMTYQGTLVTRGRATAVVVATGMNTELGQIAGLLQSVHHEPTPLQRRLSRLGRDLSIAAVFLVLLVVALGLVRGEELRVLVMVGLALAVAAVPEGLPAVATVALALGARRMLARNALIRKLPAVETLGSVTVICSDKTGTLTQNRMTVAAIAPADGPFAGEAGAAQLAERPSAVWLLVAGALCSDAELEVLAPGTTESDADANASAAPAASAAKGDPTELALVQAAHRYGLDKARLDDLMPRVAEMPFDAQRRRMSTVHELPRGASDLPLPLSAVLRSSAWLGARARAVVFTKGATGAVLDVATHVLVEGHLAALDEQRRGDILESQAALADQGMRVLGLACHSLDAMPAADDAFGLEHDLVFLGLVGISDPLRPQARAAVEHCRQAGIRPVMITGDHPRTAIAIARQAGIAVTGEVIDGRQLSSLSEGELDDRAADIEVYARVSPEDKLRIVDALARSGQIVAMTGDGVNDAPSLRRADIGVAMGIMGTDVAREAADMVLLNDDFSTIVAAVREGRRVYDNIRRFLIYTLASNAGEIVTMILAPLLGLPLALLPLQILWINLVTDGLPGLALGVEREEQGIMARPPVAPTARLMDLRSVVAIVWIGAVMGGVALAAGYAQWRWGEPASDAHWRTVVFTVLTLSQMGNALALRSFHDSFWHRSILSSPGLAASVLLTLVLQLAVIYVPYLQQVFSTVPLSATELAGCAAASMSVFWVVEGRKWLARRQAANWI